LVFALAWASLAADKSVKERFVGTWNLVSYEVRMPSGELQYPFGSDPLGRISYDAAGHMSAQLMRRDRTQQASGTSSGYTGYYGTYVVDEKAGTVTHQVEGAWTPSWIGTKQVRYFKFEGDRLTLEADLRGGRGRLVWERTR
jgi:hypothetical protein